MDNLTITILRWLQLVHPPTRTRQSVGVHKSMTMRHVPLLIVAGLCTVALGAELGSNSGVRGPDASSPLLRSAHHSNGAARLLKNNNVTTSDPFLQLEIMRNFRAQVEEERNKNRQSDRRASSEKAKRVFEKMSRQQPKAGSVERVSEEEWKDIDAKQKQRGLNWFGDSSSSGNPYSSNTLADPGSYYDKWAQAYRMLGGFIDCDHSKSDSSHDNGNNNNNNGNDGGTCSRWMMWAAYVNPNYQGNEYNEYFGENPTSTLDCHYPDTEWVLLGVYRQEFYQYVEQISKHLWKIDEYEYVVALAGLSYMSKYECFYVGKSSSGTAIYAGVAPQPFGKWQMALYTDTPYCLTPNEDFGMTYDDFGLTSSPKLNGGGGGSQDNNNNNGDYDSDVYTYWTEAQEYTLAKLNAVYEDFKYCTSCVDYPTYQDGYFIGDYGTDDDDLINQCWKFYSHSSYTCEADCIAMAHAQGSILSIKYGDAVFGKSENSFYQTREAATGGLESKFSRLLANAFVTVSFIMFVATFLAFAVARRSRYRESRSSKSRRLLDGTGSESKRSRSSSGRRSSKSTSAAAATGGEGDGIFRSSSASRSKSRSKSKSRSGNSSRRSRSKSYEAPKEKPRARSPRTNTDYF